MKKQNSIGFSAAVLFFSAGFFINGIISISMYAYSEPDIEELNYNPLFTSSLYLKPIVRADDSVSMLSKDSKNNIQTLMDSVLKRMTTSHHLMPKGVADCQARWRSVNSDYAFCIKSHSLDLLYDINNPISQSAFINSANKLAELISYMPPAESNPLCSKIEAAAIRKKYSSDLKEDKNIINKVAAALTECVTK